MFFCPNGFPFSSINDTLRFHLCIINRDKRSVDDKKVHTLLFRANQSKIAIWFYIALTGVI